jgi:hypothetical protein
VSRKRVNELGLIDSLWVNLEETCSGKEGSEELAVGADGVVLDPST